MRLKAREMAVLLILVLAALFAGCKVPRLPGPQEVEELFVGEEANVVSVRVDEVSLPEVRVERILNAGELCRRCHPDPGVNGDRAFAEEHVAEFRGSRPCADCHSSNEPQQPGGEGRVSLSFSHEVHLKMRRAECAQCHEINVHQHGLIATMATCLSCHEQTGGPTECSQCHPSQEEIIPPSHRDVDIAKTHGKVAREGTSDCTRCHVQAGYCRECHGIEMPHPESYLARHNQEVKGRPETCARCHGVDPCLQCHTERGVFPEVTG